MCHNFLTNTLLVLNTLRAKGHGTLIKTVPPAAVVFAHPRYALLLLFIILNKHTPLNRVIC